MDVLLPSDSDALAGAVRRAQSTIESLRAGQSSPDDVLQAFDALLGAAFTRDERFARLAHRYLSLNDLVAVAQRMIGTGRIGGKALGMLLARAIVRRDEPRLSALLEAHDSCFVGTDAFCEFLAANGCDDLPRRSADSAALMELSDEGRRRVLEGEFPENLRRRFAQMLDEFGPAPLIVRSSSLLEDSYANAFCGKYDSVFCANQGTPEERLAALLDAVRAVYASTWNPAALAYRAQRGVLDQDEQMGLLVQRVSGARYGDSFFPQLAGVGFSFNPFAWNADVDPRAGVLRLVFGLGTRAMDRTGDDYTRLVALNAPELRPESRRSDARRFSQRRVDVLDLARRQHVTQDFSLIAAHAQDALPLDLFATRDTAPSASWHLNFDRLLTTTALAADLREVLSALEDAYQHPVDVEFTVNFLPDGAHRINLLQCRPLQARFKGGAGCQPAAPGAEAVALVRSSGPVIGQSTSIAIDRLVYIVPAVYGKMSVSERYAVARAIGALNALAAAASPRPAVMLMAPGRWATSTPALGVPVNSAEISAASVICEIAAMHEQLVPDVSLGTHFFSELVELDMLYLAVFPDRSGNQLQDAVLLTLGNRLAELVPEAAALANAIRVIDAANLPAGTSLRVDADALQQRAVCSLVRS